MKQFVVVGSNKKKLYDFGFTYEGNRGIAYTEVGVEDLEPHSLDTLHGSHTYFCETKPEAEALASLLAGKYTSMYWGVGVIDKVYKAPDVKPVAMKINEKGMVPF